MYCNGGCVKAGRQKNGSQKLYCKVCCKYQLEKYTHLAWQADTSKSIRKLIVEGVGMRGIARILKVSLTTVLARIKTIAQVIHKPILNPSGRIVEIDEVWTFVKNKLNEVWITYAIDRKTKEIIDFRLGSRSGREIGRIVIPLIVQKVKKICTDGLNVY